MKVTNVQKCDFNPVYSLFRNSKRVKTGQKSLLFAFRLTGRWLATHRHFCLTELHAAGFSLENFIAN